MSASEGPVGVVAPEPPDSYIFLTLDEVALSLDLPVIALLLHFHKLWRGSLTVSFGTLGADLSAGTSLSVQSDSSSEISTVSSGGEGMASGVSGMDFPGSGSSDTGSVDFLDWGPGLE